MIKRDVQRLIDANLNRLREGLRVLEDVSRYIYDAKEFTMELKEIRHSLQKVYSIDRVRFRDIINDVSKETTESELKRDSFIDLIIANFSRTQESSRVLEEAFKLIAPKDSNLFKSVRYKLYDLEKRVVELTLKKDISVDWIDD
jgi:thiamine-phosphate pyrophosphorylase